MGPVVGAAGPRSVQIVAEVPSGVCPELELRRERTPKQRTGTPPDHGWTGARVAVAGKDRPGRCTHRFRIEGLDPRASYRYRVVDGSGRMLPGLSGRFRAVGQSASGARRFVLVSCNRPAAFPDSDTQQNVWRDLADRIDADRSIRLVIHCGDQVYLDPVWDDASATYYQRLEPLERARWLERSASRWRRRARKIYREVWGLPATARVLRSVPNLMMWDDHDVHDGFGSRASDFWPFGRAVSAVMSGLFDEYQASLNPPGGDGHRGFVVALLGATFAVLDTRSQRNARARRLLGQSQWDLLEERLSELSAADGPLFVVSSTPLINLALRRGFWRRAIRSIGGLTEMRDDLRDAWDSKPNRAELRRMLDLLWATRRRRVRPLAVLSGDIHVQHYGRWWRRGFERTRIHQVTSSPIGNRPLGRLGARVAYGDDRGCHRIVGARDYFGALEPPLNRRGYAIVTIDPARPPASRVSACWRVEPEIGRPLVDLKPVFLR